MTEWKNPSGREPILARRMFWDLARDECIFCDVGEFPFTQTPEGRLHPCGTPCEGNKFHDMALKDARPFRRNIVMGKLDIWRPMTLASMIARCDEEYWVRTGKATTLTDTEYDQVVERLRSLAPDHPQLQKIGQ